ncbi:hypothetical protein N657DRAFT_677301 [Parathielavia appendiculata]|uniref:Uncharacterized protein n=1 Tax=Parathielavia appendiculata TaxID=2587402 RepID=A0AAN6Z8I4_9PEZI|nr:hypothetical protein N657DRAFT_677301 [Parathielavia appendiculata]
MDDSTNKQPSSNPQKPPSLHSVASSTTLAVKADPEAQSTTQQETEFIPERYTYLKRVGPGNPDAKPKEKSKLGKLMSKFQSPAVRKTLAAREREKLEEERTGLKKHTAFGGPMSTNAATAAFM